MKKIFLKIFACCGILLITNAFAGSYLDGTRISQIAINKTIGDYIFIRIASAPIGIPSCSNHGYWHYTLPMVSAADKAIYAALVAAMMAGSTVNVGGLGNCNQFASVESLESFSVMTQ